MQHTFAQTYLTDVHTWSLRFPAAHQQSAVIWEGGVTFYYSCTLCFSGNKANNPIFLFLNANTNKKMKESQTNVEETNEEY